MAARLLDVVLATLIVGVIASAYNFLTGNSFTPAALFIVPFTLFWSLLLGTWGASGHPATLWFLALLAVTIAALVAVMRIEMRVARVLANSVVLGAQVLGWLWLFMVLRIIV